jgi:hypothetical protein
VRPIRFANRTVALGGDALLLAPEIAALEPDHPTRRFVWMLCVFSAEVDAGTASDGCAATRRARPSISARPADAGRAVSPVGAPT